MARLPIPNADDGVWGSVLNDYLAVSLGTDGALKAGVVTDDTIQAAGLSQSKIAGLSAALTAKADASALAAKADAATTATALNGKAATTHSHTIANVTGLQAALDAKADQGGTVGSLNSLTDVDTTGATDGQALVFSSGEWGPVTINSQNGGSIPDDYSVTNVKVANNANIEQSKILNLTTSLAAKADATATTSALAGKASTTHTHAASDITTGILGTARLGSGTANNTTFLRGDGTWAVPPTGSGGTVTSDSITDATTVGKSVLTASSAANARTAIGAGTSSVAIGTTAGTALDGSNAATISTKVTGSGINTITKITQANYNALSTKVSTTLYVIVG